jgi:hypothetical protein
MAIQTNEIAATTVQHIIDIETDALQKAHPIYKHIVEEGKYKASGLNVQFPIKLLKNASQAFIGLTGAIVDTTPSAQLQYGVLNWKAVNYNVNFTLQDYAFNAGAEDKADYFAQKVNGAMADFIRLQAAAIVGSSSGNALAFDGLGDALGAATGTSYAGLLDTDYAAQGLAPYLPYTSTATVVNYATVNQMITKLKGRMQKEGNVNASMMGFWNSAVQEKFLNSAQSQQRFYESKELESGFEGIKVNGVNFYLDENMNGSQDGATGDNYIYIFPKDIMKFAYVYGFGDSNKSPFDGDIQLPNQPVKSAQKYSVGNLVCVNRRLGAVCKTLVA